MSYVIAPGKTAEREHREKARTVPEHPARWEARAPGGPAPETAPSPLVVLSRTLRRMGRIFRRPLPPKELILFASQLSIMTQTGTTLVESLEALQEQATNPRLRKALAAIRGEVKSGQMMSTAMARHRDVFPDTVVAMIAIGESGGFLEDMLERICTILGKQAELRSTVRSAFTYPLVLASFCVLVVAFMMIFILPKFVAIFGDMQAALPMPTRILLGTVDLMSKRWMFIVPGILALTLAGILYLTSRTGKRRLDGWLISLPVVGGFIRNVIVSRFMRSVGELVRAGVPLLDALRVTRPLLGNVLYRDMITRVEGSIMAGKTLSSPIAESGLVPPTVAQMIRTGESNGTLSATMIKVADFYDERSRVQAKDLTTILEPMMIFLVGGIVAFVVLSLLLPIFRMSSIVH